MHSLMPLKKKKKNVEIIILFMGFCLWFDTVLLSSALCCPSVVKLGASDFYAEAAWMGI